MDKKTQNENNRQYYMFALQIVGDFGATIAVPVILLVLVGQHFDRSYHTNYLFTASGFVISAIISGLVVYRKAKYYGKEYEALNLKLRK